MKIKIFFRSLRRLVVTPVVFFLFPIMSMQALAKICSNQYTKIRNNQTFSDKFIRFTLGSNLDQSAKVFNRRLKMLSEQKRKEIYQFLWSQSATLNWAEKYFSNPRQECNRFVYKQILDLSKNLQKPIKCLELGCVVGGSYNCLQYHSIPIEVYHGVDISKNAIDEASHRFLDHKNTKFIESDFIEYLRNTNEKYDVILIKSTAFYLEEKYFHSVLEEIKKQNSADYIAIEEAMFDDMGSQRCKTTNWEWTPQTYSHNYKFIFEKDNSFKIIKHDHIIRQQRNDLIFQAIVKVDPKKSFGG